MRALCFSPFLLLACGQEITTAPADCGVGSVHSDADTSPQDDASVARDASTPRDASDLDASALDASTMDASAPLACHVDPFSSCQDPLETNSNNEPSDPTYRSLMPGRGCDGASDDFEAGTDMIMGRVCHTEPADWFEYVHLPCRNVTFVIELRVRVTTPCERDAWSLTVQNRPCDGTNPDVQCSWDGEWRVVQALVRPSSSIGQFKFGVSQPDNSTAFDYEAVLLVRR